MVCGISILIYKKTMGEHISSKKMDIIIDEVAWKTQLYNRYTQLPQTTNT